MNIPVIVLNQAQIATSASFGSMVRVFIMVLLAFVVVLLLILIRTYASTVHSEKMRKRLTRSIKEATQKAMSAKSDKQAHEILSSKEIFTRAGLAVLGDVFAEMDKKDKNKLKTVLLQLDIEKNLAAQLKSDNEDYLIELIHLTCDLELTSLADAVANAMVTHYDNTDVQYEAFMTLSIFGSYDKIIDICKNKDFVLTLSFRSLQEIIGAYTGNKPALFKALLGSADAYINRVCIKEIGSNGIKELAGEVVPFMDSENINLIMDAVRTLSALKYTDAVEKIRTFLEHERWEVRCVAVTSLAEIEVKSHIDDFVKALQDSEWQVRYNAGSVLSAVPDDEGEIIKKVAATGDNFAIEMMNYMKSLAQLGRAEK